MREGRYSALQKPPRLKAESDRKSYVPLQSEVRTTLVLRCIHAMEEHVSKRDIPLSTAVKQTKRTPLSNKTAVNANAARAPIRLSASNNRWVVSRSKKEPSTSPHWTQGPSMTQTEMRCSRHCANGWWSLTPPSLPGTMSLATLALIAKPQSQLTALN